MRHACRDTANLKLTTRNEQTKTKFVSETDRNIF